MGKADAVLAVLRVSSDNDILHALSVILGERPPLMEHIASLIEQGQAQGERVVGVIKSFDAAKGFGFIQCDDTFAVHQRDVFLSDKQLGPFMVGALVSFDVTLNNKGHPQAQSLEDAEPRGPPHGWNQNGPRSFEDTPQGHYVGTIKKFDKAKRFGFIECPELFHQFGRDTFLSDVQIGDFEVGSQVSFQMTLNQQGLPQAQELQDVGAHGGSAFAPPPAGRGGALPPAKRQRTTAGGSAVPGVTRHVGVIKKFQPEKHHGQN